MILDRSRYIFVWMILLVTSAISWGMYQPETGRFIQQDPIGVRDGICLIEFNRNGCPVFLRKHHDKDQYKDGMNIYQYCKSNPVNYLELYGLWCGVVAKQQDIDRKAGDMGHRWIEGCNSSWGWWPKKDSAGGLEYWGGTPGELQSPDEKQGEKYNLLWVTGRKLDGIMKFGPKAGTNCKCVTECADVCACLRSLRVHGIWGNHKMLWNPEEAKWTYDENSLYINQGNCRGGAGLFLEACCLKALHPPKRVKKLITNLRL